MKTLAVIAEYNPFHNGHLYQLNQSRELTGADYSISVMSGNFLQRGTAALTDKYTRAHMALSSDLDLVLELPFAYATGSALDFSMGAVSLLNKLNSVDYLCFGAETPDLNLFYKVADILLCEPDSFKYTLKSYLSQGFSFPLSRSKALMDYCNDSSISIFLSSPNNILGIEYITSLLRTKSNITPVPILRKNAGYYDTRIYGNISSATAIRGILQKSCSDTTNTLSSVKDDIPENTFNILNNTFNTKWPINADALSPFLQSSLLNCNDISNICDINNDIANKITKLDTNISFSKAVDILTTKELTANRINRCLIHMIMNYTQTDRISFIDNGYAFYASILGFRKDSTSLIKAINSQTDIPLINKKADFYSIISNSNHIDEAKRMWQLDTKATELFNCLVYNSLGHKNNNDYNTSPIIIK